MESQLSQEQIAERTKLNAEIQLVWEYLEKINFKTIAEGVTYQGVTINVQEICEDEWSIIYETDDIMRKFKFSKGKFDPKNKETITLEVYSNDPEEFDVFLNLDNSFGNQLMEEENEKLFREIMNINAVFGIVFRLTGEVAGVPDKVSNCIN